MTDSVTSRSPRHDSHSNRARILAVARRELGRDPATTLEDIARAAGVVRRTVFGHFPGRQALLEAVVEESAHAMSCAADQRPQVTEAPEQTLGRLILSLWDIGDHYQLLRALQRRDPTMERVTRALAPVCEEATDILARGQLAGVFHTLASPVALGVGLEALTVSLLASVNAGSWSDDGTSTAAAVLIAAGISERNAISVVEGIAEEISFQPVAVACVRGMSAMLRIFQA